MVDVTDRTETLREIRLEIWSQAVKEPLTQNEFLRRIINEMTTRTYKREV